MSTSLPNKPSSPPVARRQLPQHPKMRLSYILNPSPPTQLALVQPVEPAPVPLREQPVSRCPSSPSSSDFGDVLPSESQLKSPSRSPVLLPSGDMLSTSTACIPDLSANLPPYSLFHPHPYPRSSSPPSENSRSLPSEFQFPIPLLPCFDPESAFDSVRYSLSYNSNSDADNYHDSRNALGTNSFMNQGGTELPILPDRPPIYPPIVRSSPLQPHDLNTLSNNSLHPDSTDETPSSSTMRYPLPRHPKMELSYILNPSTTVYEHEETTPELVDPNPVPSPTSRSPSPTVSDSEISSSSTSFSHSNGSPDRTRQPRLTSPPHDQSQLPSPATTPPSSPLPVFHPIPDLPQMVQPPQLLPWEGPPPPGLNARNHQAYQRAGVHWMLAEIFGPDIG